MRGDVGLGLYMDVLGAVETWWRAGAHAVGAQDLDRFLFEGFVGDQIVEVVGGKVGDCAAI